MYDKSPDIAALISSRICHDLVSPLGAISNGLELLELSGIPRSPEFALLNESIEAANARIKFFRIAYGTAASEAVLDPGAVQQILADYFAGRRVQAHWMSTSSLPRRLGKLLFLLIQCAETALPFGGTICVKETPGNWRVEASGQIKRNETIWQAFQTKEARLSLQASDIQFELARSLAARMARQIRVSDRENTLAIEIS